MGFKAKNVEIGNIPKWMVEQASPSIDWDRHKELLEEGTQELKQELSQKTSKLKFLEEKNENSLTEQELMFLLHFIKEASFKGGQLEHIFQVTLKLQNQYRFLEKNNEENGQL